MVDAKNPMLGAASDTRAGPASASRIIDPHLALHGEVVAERLAFGIDVYSRDRAHAVVVVDREFHAARDAIRRARGGRNRGGGAVECVNRGAVIESPIGGVISNAIGCSPEKVPFARSVALEIVGIQNRAGVCIHSQYCRTADG